MKQTTDEKLIKDLTQIYPAHKIDKDFRKEHDNIYQRVLTTSKRRKLSIDEYLLLLGFERVQPIERLKGSEIENFLIENLIKIYPDHEITKNFIAKYPNIYMKVYANAKKRGLSIDEYLLSLGFERVKMSEYKTPTTNFEIDNLLKKELAILYPDHKITQNFKEEHPDIYKRVLVNANKGQLSIDKYLSQLGFVRMKVSTINLEIESFIKDELNRLYPDHKIPQGFYGEEGKLFDKIRSQAKKIGISLSEYLSILGYEKTSKVKRPKGNETDTLLIEDLSKIFPDHEIAQDFHKKYYNIYSRVITNARRRQLSIDEYLLQLGFKRIK